MPSFRLCLPFCLTLLLVMPTATLAAGVQAMFDLSSPSKGPFPSDAFTVLDPTQNTGVVVSLPKPDCATHPTDCADIDVINTLDGFNIQPRISIPFSAPIDLSTVSSSTIFLVGPGGDVVGINQAEWEPLTNTLHVESDEQLAQDTTYLLVVTRDVHDASGDSRADWPSRTNSESTMVTTTARPAPASENWQPRLNTVEKLVDWRDTKR